MSNPPESWRLKIARAHHHLREIEVEVAAHASTQAHAAVRVLPAKGKQHIWVYNLKVTSHPDPMLAVIIGDVVHNARSALDHIAVALVPKKFRSNASFPIRMTDPRARNKAGDVADPEGLARFESAIRGAPATAVAVIEEMQPYRTPEPFFDSLGVLSRLDNADKHRQLIVVTSGLRDTKTNIRHRGKPVLSQDGPGLRDDGAEVARFKPEGKVQPRESEVKVEVRGTPVVAMKVTSDDEARRATGSIGAFRLPDALDRLLVEVTEILDTLEPHVVT